MIECPLLKKCKEDGISDKKRKEVKKMKKRTLALVMAGTMVMGLTACGGTASSSATASDDKTTSDAASSAYMPAIQEQMLLTKAASEVALSRVFIRKRSECD